MRLGRRLAIDVGKVRIGLAISDQQGLLATPFATIQRKESDVETVEDLRNAVDDYDFVEIYVGLPLNLSGNHTPSTENALALAFQIEESLGTAVRMIDERLTTVTAAATLRGQGKSSKSARSIIDQEAAAIILEHALNQEKLSGQAPGRSLSEFERPAS